MKEYVELAINRLNKLIKEHPTADLRYGKNTFVPSAKILECDVSYNEKNNTIFIG